MAADTPGTTYRKNKKVAVPVASVSLIEALLENPQQTEFGLFYWLKLHHMTISREREAEKQSTDISFLQLLGYWQQMEAESRWSLCLPQIHDTQIWDLNNSWLVVSSRSHCTTTFLLLGPKFEEKGFMSLRPIVSEGAEGGQNKCIPYKREWRSWVRFIHILSDHRYIALENFIILLKTYTFICKIWVIIPMWQFCDEISLKSCKGWIILW